MTTFKLQITTPRSNQASAAQVAQIAAVTIPLDSLRKAYVGPSLSDGTVVVGTNVVRTLTFPPLPRTLAVLANVGGTWNGNLWSSVPSPPDLTQSFVQTPTTNPEGGPVTFPPLVKVIEVRGTTEVNVSLAPVASPATWAPSGTLLLPTGTSPGQIILPDSLLTEPLAGLPRVPGAQPALVTATYSDDGSVEIRFLATIQPNSLTPTTFVAGTTLTIPPGGSNPNFLITLTQRDTQVVLVALQPFQIGKYAFLPGQILPQPMRPGTVGGPPRVTSAPTPITNVTLTPIAAPALFGIVPVPPNTLISQTTSPTLPALVQGYLTPSGVVLVVLQSFTTRNGTVSYTAGQTLPGIQPVGSDFTVVQTSVGPSPPPPHPIPGLVLDITDPADAYPNPNVQSTALLGHYRPAIELVAMQRNVVETVTAASP
jgi:hypothetical protein